MSSRILVTGTSSGLGRFLKEKLKADEIHHADIDQNLPGASRPYDIIIHCAFTGPQNTEKDENLIYLRKILSIPHNKFIFISSSDVYPQGRLDCNENDEIDLNSLKNVYSQQKKMCEDLIVNNESSYLILRPVSLISKEHMSLNLKKLISEAQPHLTLTADSSWNFVTYEELYKCIELLKSNQGVFNVARSSSVRVSEVAQSLRKNPEYGKFQYKVASLNNNKILQFMPELKESSGDFVKKWIAENS
ncbi:MAG: NAD-dependent epimerase/dehydratase family protein [Pseudobdellovibrio sp.]